MYMAPRYRELRDMTDEELAERYDRVAANSSEGIAFYLDEIVRRDLIRAIDELRRATERLDSARPRHRALGDPARHRCDGRDRWTVDHGRRLTGLR